MPCAVCRALPPTYLPTCAGATDALGAEGLPPDSELLYYLAYCHGRTGQREAALGLLRRVLVLNPAHQDAQKIYAAMTRS